MNAPTEGLQFALDVLQKALVSKDDEIEKMKRANQIQLYVLLNEIDKRDEKNDELKEKVQSLEISMQSVSQEIVQYKYQIEQLKDELQLYRDCQSTTINCKTTAKQKEIKRAQTEKDIRLLNYIQQTHGCHAAWDLADRCFKVTKGHNLPSILGSFQSKLYLDMGEWRLIKCVQCARFRTTENKSTACLAMKFKASNRTGFGIYLAYPIEDFDSDQLFL